MMGFKSNLETGHKSTLISFGSAIHKNASTEPGFLLAGLENRTYVQGSLDDLMPEAALNVGDQR